MTTTTKISSYYVDINNEPQAHSVVVATLIGPTTFNGGSVARVLSTKTDVNGYWSLNLIPNIVFSAQGSSYYDVRIGSKEQYRIIVPNSVNEIPITSVLLNDTPAFNYTGNLTFSNDLIVYGSINVTGSVTAKGFEKISTTIAESTADFRIDLNVTGNLVVGNMLRYTGTINYASAIVSH